MIQLDHFIAGRQIKDPSGYTYFLPTPINDQWNWEDQGLNLLLEQAALKLGELNSYARLVPSVDLFIQLLVTKEAVVSSRIEGTQTNMEEALLDESDIDPERKNDWREVQNYIKALNQALIELDRLPISSRLLRQTHQTLLTSVRGEQKLPGEYRRSQNWIGGASLRTARFIPPHHDYVSELMSDLERFLHNEEIALPQLVKAGIAHYQFETIHPFLDGNGRIGRLLIPLYLVDRGLLSAPLLYISAFFEQNKSLYYDSLTIVRTKNDMRQWLSYFLEGVSQTASNASQTLARVIELKQETEPVLLRELGRRSAKAVLLLQRLFERPTITVNQAKELLQVSFKSANDLINEFVRIGILKEMTGQNRNRVFVFEEYLALFRA
jgi:Fic family protein